MSKRSFRSGGFTLIELLVVIAIIAILSIVVVLTLNPAQLLMQSRDSDRVSDMSTLNSALGIYSAQGGLSLGTANIIYVSIPDPTATSTAGDQCQGLGLISLPAGYSYQCAASSTYRLTNGTGWIPVNFSSMAAGSPLSILPIDPINTSSSRNYYSYTTNGSQYELTSNMESAKYQLGGSNDVIGNDGGTLASVYEKGSKLGLEPLDYGDTSLVGLWTFSEGSSSIAYDYSGNNATGSWHGTATGTFGYYSVGKIGPYAGAFDGSSGYIKTAATAAIAPSSISVFAWVNLNSSANQYPTVLGLSGAQLGFYGNSVSPYTTYQVRPCISTCNVYGTFSTNSWVMVGYTYSAASGNAIVYLNGVAYAPYAQTFTPQGIVCIGTVVVSPFTSCLVALADMLSGLIDDVRIYNRALTAAQIAAMYAGGK